MQKLLYNISPSPMRLEVVHVALYNFFHSIIAGTKVPTHLFGPEWNFDPFLILVS